MKISMTSQLMSDPIRLKGDKATSQRVPDYWGCDSEYIYFGTKSDDDVVNVGFSDGRENNFAYRKPFYKPLFAPRLGCHEDLAFHLNRFLHLNSIFAISVVAVCYSGLDEAILTI